MDALLKVEFQVDAEDDLRYQHEHEDRGEGGVDVWCELAAAMGVAKEVTDDCEYDAEDLERDMESGADDLRYMCQS